jgi:hypothetical protein
VNDRATAEIAHPNDHVNASPKVNLDNYGNQLLFSKAELKQDSEFRGLF